MHESAPRFVRALAAAVLRDGDPTARAAEAHAALAEVLAGQKSLVLDVQFTGFTHKGQLVGGVDPLVLRAAGHLITLRVNRIGFTPDAHAADLQDTFHHLGRGAGELGEGGIVAAMAAARPHGVYLSTSSAEVYKPAPRTLADPGAPVDASPAPAATPSPTTPADAPPTPAETTSATVDAPTPAVVEPVTPGAWSDSDFESTELGEFEIVDAADLLAAPPGREGGPAPAARPEAGEPPVNDMFHFFRTAASVDEQAEALPRLLAETDNVSRFDELADMAVRTAVQLLRSDAHAEAVEVLDALVREAQRPDRTRLFRDSALQAIRRVGSAETLQRLVELLGHGGIERERILRFLAFTGGDALLMLEGFIHRSPDAESRFAAFRTLLAAEGTADRLIAHAVQDPNPVRVRTLLELAGGPGVDPEVARRWAAEAARHADAGIRADAARSAAALGGRGSLRVLVDLLGDPERVVRREAVQGLGGLGETAAVPFLARVLNDSGDEEMQALAAQSLGRIGSAEALPGLLGVVNKRSLFSLNKVTRVKMAALQAIARIRTPGAREALQSVATGRDELAEEAKRLLAGL
jgi:HEAT repeat protein